MTRADTVAVIAFVDPQTIILTQQEQPGRASFMDVAGGRIEPGETVEETARREFLEETGYEIGTLAIFRQTELRGSARLVKTVVLAKDLKPAPHGNNPDAGERITIIKTPWNEAVTLSLQHKLRGEDSMLAILAMEFDPEMRVVKDRFLAS
jgi:8-oxo-dGTP pyrophosphatase MutT (NUDIX family)